MAAMGLNDYKPKYGQDQEVFNHMYMNYVSNLHSDNVSDNQSSASS